MEPEGREERSARFRRARAQGRVPGLVRRARAEREAVKRGEYVPQGASLRLGFPVAPTAKARRPECGARCRDGHACRAKVADGAGRCRMHGGLSTGPRTEAGRRAIAESNRRRAEACRQETEAKRAVGGMVKA